MPVSTIRNDGAFILSVSIPAASFFRLSAPSPIRLSPPGLISTGTYLTFLRCMTASHSCPSLSLSLCKKIPHSADYFPPFGEILSVIVLLLQNRQFAVPTSYHLKAVRRRETTLPSHLLFRNPACDRVKIYPAEYIFSRKYIVRNIFRHTNSHTSLIYGNPDKKEREKSSTVPV